MGTHGTGAFASDGAMDFLDELLETPAERRASGLARLFGMVKDHPDLLGREFFADELVAAAAIVAATLPGGSEFEEQLHRLVDGDLLAEIPLAEPAYHLADLALGALLLVAAPDGPSHQGWVTETDAHEARATTDRLALILGEAATEASA